MAGGAVGGDHLVVVCLPQGVATPAILVATVGYKGNEAQLTLQPLLQAAAILAALAGEHLSLARS